MAEVGLDEQLAQFRQKSRRDLMYELRRLSHQDRVVTQRQAELESLLNSVVAHRLHQARSSVCSDCKDSEAEYDNVSGKLVAAAEANGTMSAGDDDTVDPSLRPAEIEDEMQTLVTRQRVTELLASRFRPLLERAVTVSSTRFNRLQEALRPRPRPRPRNLPVPSMPDEGLPPAGAVPPQVRPRQESSRWSRPAQQNGEPSGNATRSVDVHPEEVYLIRQMEQIQHEGVLLEVEEVMHHHVVSAVMASQFRNVLERHLEDRLSRIDADGDQVERFVRGLAQQHNDASSRANVSARHDNSSELLSLKNDMRDLMLIVRELDRRVKLSFELQMDNQRLLRQEVAAISHSVLGTQPAACQAPLQNVPGASGVCVICQTTPSDCTFYSCGHLCSCSLCARDLMARPSPVCPICRAPVKDVIKVYHV